VNRTRPLWTFLNYTLLVHNAGDIISGDHHCHLTVFELPYRQPVPEKPSFLFVSDSDVVKERFVVYSLVNVYVSQLEGPPCSLHRK
jgi:hypothetical protein